MAGLAWFGAAAPVLDWYAGRQETLAQQQALLARLQGLAESLPMLEQRADAAARAGQPRRAAASDAVAGAELQEAVQAAARQAGLTISSVEVLPAQAVGTYRRIGLKVAAASPWPVLVAMLRTLSDTQPRVLVNDLTLQQASDLAASEDRPLQAGFTVLGFEPGQAAAQ